MSTFKQLSPTIKFALVAALLVGVFFLYKSQTATEEVPAPAAPVAAAAPTGATGGATGETGGTGETGATGEADEPTAAEKRAARRKELIAKAEEAGMPLPVYEGLHDNKAVLIFFRNMNGQTDQHVNQAVKEVKSVQGSKLVVVNENISNKSKYSGIAKVTEISQTPGIVMLYGTKADSWQGYIDGVALNARLEQLLEQG
ncbi:MAG: hypothetical protein QM648_07990 [Solirubrobacterales bacterium]